MNLPLMFQTKSLPLVPIINFENVTNYLLHFFVIDILLSSISIYGKKRNVSC